MEDLHERQSEFLAAMGKELRTPVNAIVRIPKLEIP